MQKIRKNFALLMAIMAVGALSIMPALATPPTGTAIDTSGYAQSFADMQATLSSVATGTVGQAALGLLITSVVFGLVWKLVKKGGKALG